MEPIAEEMADLSSYGFRPIRGTSSPSPPLWGGLRSKGRAVGRTLNAIANPLTKYGYVVEVDIKGCFDNIDHDFIKQISPVVPRHILNEWLNCGYMERESEDIIETNKGVPQYH
jgi:RNA-directed DNA polymerase